MVYVAQRVSALGYQLLLVPRASIPVGIQKSTFLMALTHLLVAPLNLPFS